MSGLEEVQGSRDQFFQRQITSLELRTSDLEKCYSRLTAARDSFFARNAEVMIVLGIVAGFVAGHLAK